MSDSPAAILFDVNGNPVGVSGSLALPTGTIGQLIAGVDANNIVRYLTTVSGSLSVTGSVIASVPSQLSINNFPATQNVSGSVSVLGAVATYTQGLQGVSGSVVATGTVQAWSGGTQAVSGNVSVAYQPNVTGSTYITSTGSLPVAVVGTVPVSIASQLQISNFPATQAVSGTVSVGGAVAVYTQGLQGVSGSVTVSGVTTVSASVPLSVFNLGNVGVTGSVMAWSQGTQAVSGTVTANVTTTGSTGLLVAAAQAVPLWVTGAVALNPTPVITANTATTGTAGLAVGNAPYQPLYVSITSSLPVFLTSQVQVSNFPATQNVSGSVTVSGVTTVSASVPLSVFNLGTVGISGTVTANVTTTGSTGLLVAAAAAVPLWVTGSVALNPTPVITANTVTTGTAGLAVGNAPYQPLYVSITSSLPVSFPAGVNVTTTGSTGLLVAAAAAVPLWVTGSVGLTTVVQSSTATTGTAGLAVGNAPYQPLYVSITSSLPVTFASLPQLQVSNFPVVQAVSGSQLTGSTFAGSPVVIGGVFYTSGVLNSGSYVKSIETDISGAVYITTSGSLPVAVVGTVPVSIAGTINVSQQGQIQVSNFPATQAVSGTVAVSSISQPVSVFNASTVGVSGTVGVNNFPATQNVSGTVTANVTVTGSTGLAVGNAPYQPLFISVTSSLPVTLSSQVQVSNFPATQNVSGTVTANVTVTGSTGLAVGNAAYQPLFISVTSSLPVTFAGLAPLSVWNASIVGVSGTVQTWTSGPQAVTGSQLTGSTFVGNPVVIAGVFYTSGVLNSGSYIKALQTDISGAAYITTSGSLPVAVVGTVPVSIASQLQISNFPATQAISGTVGINNFPLTQNVSGTVTANVTVTGSTGLAVGNASYAPLFVTLTSSLPVNVTSQIQVSNFPATQNVSGSVSVIGVTNVSASVPLSVFNLGTVGVSGTVTSNVTTTGSTGLLVAAPAAVPLWITGSVGLTTVVQSSTATTGTAGLAVGNAPYQPLFISITSSLPVTLASQVQVSNFPATQAVSGTVTANVTTTGSTGLLVAAAAAVPLWITGAVGLTTAVQSSTATTGTLGLAVGNAPYAPLYVSITSSLPVTGLVQTWSSNPTGISASLILPVFNAAPVAVSGSQLTGSTFLGSPVVVAGVFYTSGVLNSGSYVKAVQTDISGAVYITTSGSIPVTIGAANVTVTGSTGLQVSFGQGSWNLSGSIPVSPGTGAAFVVTTSGSTGLDVTLGEMSWGLTGSLPVVITGVSGSAGVQVSLGQAGWNLSGSVPVVIAGVSGSAGVQVSLGQGGWNLSGSIPVAPGTGAQFNVSTTGSLGLNVGNAPYTPLFISITSSLPVSLASSVAVAVSGSQLTGSTFNGFPVVMGAMSASLVRVLSASLSGALLTAPQFQDRIGYGWLTVASAGTNAGAFGNATLFADIFASGTYVAMDVGGFSTVLTVVSNSFNGTIEFEGSPDGLNWCNVQGSPLGGMGTGVGGNTGIGNLTSQQCILRFSVGGLKAFRARALSNFSVINAQSPGALIWMNASNASYESLNDTMSSQGFYPMDIVAVNGTSLATAFVPAMVSTTGSKGLNVTNTIKGTQNVQGLQTQDFKDSGRTIKCFCTSSMSGVLGEALFNMQAMSAFTLSASVTSSWFPTNGKTLRLQNATLMVTAPQGTTGSVFLRLRVTNAAPGTGASVVSAKSPSVWCIGATIGTPGLQGGGSAVAQTIYTDFPDGFEFTNTQQLGFTQQSTSTAIVIDFNVIGFEY